ncbi:MAG: bifunctional riboflavin kinase/FAD synthetase [Acidimicrobiales bacterium]
MEVIRESDVGTFRLGASVVSIGTYDGIHLGHRHVMAQLKERADQERLPPVVVTFDRHPLSVVRPGSEPLQLTTLTQRLELLGSLGISYAYVLEFDERRARESAEDFIDRVLIETLGARTVLVGEDFRFGHGRRGDLAMISERGQRVGLSAQPVSLLRVGEVLGDAHRDATLPVSSTLIRGYLADGILDDANRLLGRDYVVRGTVSSGDHRGGDELGYPTANLTIPPGLAVPADGVYAGALIVEGSEMVAAISVGTRPTYYPRGGPRLIESFVLDYSGDLYGQEVEVVFRQFLRRQETFSSTDALIHQIDEDVRRVRASFPAQEA